VLDGKCVSPADACLRGTGAEGAPSREAADGRTSPGDGAGRASSPRPSYAAGSGRATGGRYRLQYEKKGSSRFLSHLDMVRAFTRAFRVSRLPVAFSEGYTRRPRVSFGPPLPLGFTGSSEYLDVELASAPETDPAEELNLLLPPGVRVLEWKRLEPGTQSLSASCTVARYTVVFPEHLVAGTGLSDAAFRERLASAVRGFDPGARVTVRREDSPKQKVVTLGAAVQELSLLEGGPPGLEMLLSLGGPDSLRPDDAAAALLGDVTFEKKYLHVERNAVYLRGSAGIGPPM
jgi:radical SAM-linked protein